MIADLSWVLSTHYICLVQLYLLIVYGFNVSDEIIVFKWEWYSFDGPLQRFRSFSYLQGMRHYWGISLKSPLIILFILLYHVHIKVCSDSEHMQWIINSQRQKTLWIITLICGHCSVKNVNIVRKVAKYIFQDILTWISFHLLFLPYFSYWIHMLSCMPSICKLINLAFLTLFVVILDSPNSVS